MIVAGDHKCSSSRLIEVVGIIDGSGWVCQRKNGRGAARPSFLLAQRAASEGPRWTRAVKDSLATPLESDVGGNEKNGRVACCPPLLAERARWECARSTRAVGGQTGHPPVGVKLGIRKDGNGEWPGALLARRTEEGMEADDLLCSRNARSRTPLVGRAQWKIHQPPSLEKQRASVEGAFISFDARSKGQPRPPPCRERRDF